VAEAQRLALLGLSLGPLESASYPLAIETSLGTLNARWYDVAGAHCGILWLGMAANEALARRFLTLGAVSLSLAFRHPEDGIQRGLDAMLGVYLLREQALTTLAVVSDAPAPTSLNGLPVFQQPGAPDEVISEWLLRQFQALRRP
jgi:hypothetical protein